MGEINTHKDLQVYQKAMDFVVDIYRVTSFFPDSEKYGLVSQLRRSAVSIPSNIAEGAARQSINEYMRFLYISLGSLAEIETQLEIAIRLNFCANDDISALPTLHIKRMMLKMIDSLKKKSERVSK